MRIILIISGMLLTLVTLPLVLELFAVTSAFLFLPRRRRKQLGTMFSLTVVVPAHNEEGLIRRCVDSLISSAQGAAKVLVIAHNCSDETAARAVESGAEVLVLNDLNAKGKGHALRYGFKYALANGAGAVLVVDADSVVSENLIPRVIRRLSEGVAAVQCRYEMLCVDKSARGQLASLAFRASTFIRGVGRDRLGLSAGISGNGFALSANLLNKVPYDALSVVEDLEYHIHAVMAGERVRFLERSTVFSNFPVSSTGGVSQQSRWQGGRVWAARKYLPSLCRRICLGDFRLMEPALDLAALPLAFGIAALVIEAFIPLHWIHIYVVSALCVAAAHVIAAAWAGPSPMKTLSLLVIVPFYILWKLALLPKMLKMSSGKAAWIRTDRGATVASQADGATL